MLLDLFKFLYVSFLWPKEAGCFSLWVLRLFHFYLTTRHSLWFKHSRFRCIQFIACVSPLNAPDGHLDKTFAHFTSEKSSPVPHRRNFPSPFIVSRMVSCFTWDAWNKLDQIKWVLLSFSVIEFATVTPYSGFLKKSRMRDSCVPFCYSPPTEVNSSPG